MNVRTLYRRCPQALLRSPLGLACPYVSWVLNEARLSSFSEEGRPNDCGGTDLQANLRSPAAISSNIASPSWERAEGRANVPIGAVREKNFEEKGWKLRVAEAREFVWEKLAVLIDRFSRMHASTVFSAEYSAPGKSRRGGIFSERKLVGCVLLVPSGAATQVHYLWGCGKYWTRRCIFAILELLHGNIF